MSYFRIFSDGDGTYNDKIDISKFLKDLANGDYGDNPVILDEVPAESNANYWPEGSYLIIKGEVVTPKPTQVVTQWMIE